MAEKFTRVDDDEDSPQDFSDNGTPTEDRPDFETIFNAPDYASLITVKQSVRARQYTSKLNSVLKTFVTLSINGEDFADAATLLHYGPPFSHAWGQMADENKNVARAINLMTSPSSPVVMAAMTTAVLVAQLMRNHEDQIRQVPEKRREAKRRKKAMAGGARQAEPPRFTVKIWRWQIPIRFSSRIKLSKLLGGFRAQTQEPEALMLKVFSDERVIKALEKQGYTIGHKEKV